MCALLLHCAVVVVANNVECCEVLAEVVLHCGLGMLDSDVVVLLVASKMPSVEQEVEVHHVVDDNWEVPTSKVPRADATDALVEA